jgi:hypothetical protein
MKIQNKYLLSSQDIITFENYSVKINKIMLK